MPPVTKKEIYSNRSERPKKLRVNLDNVPQYLRELPQWVNWDYKWKEKNTKWDKPPCYNTRIRRRRSTGKVWDYASSTDPNTWISFEELRKEYERFAGKPKNLDKADTYYGVGFVLTKDSGVVVIDIDDCRNKETGELTPEAAEIIHKFNTYTQISASGTGVHLFFLAKKEKMKCRKGHVEIYNHGRYMAFTANRIEGTPPDLQPRQQQLDELLASMFPEEEEKQRRTPTASSSQAPVLLSYHSMADVEIINRIEASAQAGKFRSLYSGDISAYGNDRSAADMALAGLLRFWCRGDAAQIASIMRGSGLARDKWNRTGDDYLKRTIDAALQGGGEYYDPDYGRRQAEARQQERDRREAEAHASNIASNMRLVETIRETMARPPQPPPPDTRSVFERAAYEETHRRLCDFESFTCNRPHRLLFAARDGRDVVVGMCRCKRRAECEGCRAYLNERETIRLDCRFKEAAERRQQLYEYMIGPADWIKFRRRLKGANFLRMQTQDANGNPITWIVTTAQLDGKLPIDSSVVLENVRRLLEENHNRRTPLRTSHGWRHVRGMSDYVVVGIPDGNLTRERIEQIAAMAGGVVEDKLVRNPCQVGMLLRYHITLADDRNWKNDEGTMARMDHLIWCLCHNIVMRYETACGACGEPPDPSSPGPPPPAASLDPDFDPLRYRYAVFPH